MFVVPIVEGYGDVAAVPVLLSRIYEHVGGREFLVTLPPIRQPRSRLVRPHELKRAVELAAMRLSAIRDPAARRLVLILIDADEDLACVLAPRLLADARSGSPFVDVACVLAVVEYETWFVAAANSLAEFLDLDAGEAAAADPESARHGKRWIERRFRGPKYSETIDQRRMTAVMDPAACRAGSRSFDKLCREIESRCSVA